jgi:hypothetical protein
MVVSKAAGRQLHSEVSGMGKSQNADSGSEVILSDGESVRKRIERVKGHFWLLRRGHSRGMLKNKGDTTVGMCLGNE